MSKNETSFIDQYITFYMRGGWELSGIVIEVDDEDICLKNVGAEGGFIIIKRKEISAIQFGEAETKQDDFLDPKVAGRYNIRAEEIEENEYSDAPPINGLGQDNLYGAVIPEDMLLESETGEPIDLGMSFTPIKDLRNRESK